MKAKRGTAPKATALSVIGKALMRLGMAGPIGPATVLGLTVPRGHALAELQMIFNRKGWGWIVEAEFDAALAADGIARYNMDSPEASERRRLLARQRAATARR